MKLPDILPLPKVIRSHVEEVFCHMLYAGQDRQDEFLNPAGETAIVSADSVSWRVFKNPVALFIGGVAAVILELAEERVRHGVWKHSQFRFAPVERLQRTGLAAMVTVYSGRSVSEAMIARVNSLHRQICGVTPQGTAYRASESELLRWVHLTASYGFLEAYDAYVRPLTAEEKDRFYAEALESARLYGATDIPTSMREVMNTLETMEKVLQPSPVIVEFLHIMRTSRMLPPPYAWLQPALVDAAIGILPVRLGHKLELRGRSALSPWRRAMVKSIGAIADRVFVETSPAVLACRRLGLPADYLYRQPGEKGSQIR